LDNGSVITYLPFGDEEQVYNGTTSTESQGENTTYTFTLPDGLPSGIFANELYSWRFKMKVKNNIVDIFSEESEITDGTGVDSDTQIDGTAT
jgi:peroxiredoxin